ncbi:hypothetical protein ARMGADRAFT_1020175, partial [Armillaria gallica]
MYRVPASEQRQQCVEGQTEMRRAMGEEISFDRPAVSTLCHHARLPHCQTRHIRGLNARV